MVNIIGFSERGVETLLFVVLLGGLLFSLTVPSVIYFFEFDIREWSLFINREEVGLRIRLWVWCS